ncbi:hypothetical protein BJ170DRAFT_605538 [Xylariales sp. AK1849]|nr:hypothetical protein BJ170DRAFT_605538 [Xylariales sp. AK1849]
MPLNLRLLAFLSQLSLEYVLSPFRAQETGSRGRGQGGRQTSPSWCNSDSLKCRIVYFIHVCKCTNCLVFLFHFTIYS